MMRTAAFLVCGALVGGAIAAFPQARPDVFGGWLEDQFAIDRAIDSLNNPSRLSNAFARSGDGAVRSAELRASTPARAFEILGPLGSAVPAVKISHEPWGEADLGLTNILRHIIVFIAPDVALAEGACVYEDADGSTRRKPLVFVLKKEAGGWKIASLRMLASEGAFTPAFTESGR